MMLKYITFALAILLVVYLFKAAFEDLEVLDIV